MDEEPTEFTERRGKRNLPIYVDGKVLYAPRDLLACHSSVFDKMIYGDDGSENSDGFKIDLTESRFEDVLELLRVIVPSSEKRRVNDKNVDLLLNFAETFQMESLEEECETFLFQRMEKMSTTEPKLLEILTVASKYRLKHLLRKLIPRCANLSIDIVRQRHSRIRHGDLAALYQAMAIKFCPPHGNNYTNGCNNGYANGEKHVLATCAKEQASSSKKEEGTGLETRRQSSVFFSNLLHRNQCKHSCFACEKQFNCENTDPGKQSGHCEICDNYFCSACQNSAPCSEFGRQCQRCQHRCTANDACTCEIDVSIDLIGSN